MEFLYELEKPNILVDTNYNFNKTVIDVEF